MPKPAMPILPPTWGAEPIKILRGAKAAAAHLRWTVRRVFRECESKRLPHWIEGKNQLYFNTGVLDLHQFLRQVYELLGRRYGREDIAKCLPLYAMVMQGIWPTIDDITNVLIKVGVLRQTGSKAD
jgi:hypothetical protein